MLRSRWDAFWPARVGPGTHTHGPERVGAGLLVALGVAAAVLIGAAAPVGADPAEPTEYRSTVTAVSPATDAVRVDVVGGDAFLRLRAEPGHEVVVPGYRDEPYLRFRADGTVEENRRSEATYINEDRYAEVEVPADVDPADEPEWLAIDDDGEYTWHDHRIHWMSPERRPGVEPGDVVQEWSIPLNVDGEEVVVDGTLVLVAGISPLPWVGLGVVVVAAVLAAGWRRWSLAVGTGAALAAGVLGVAVGRGELGASPAGTGASALVLIVPAVGLVAALVAVGLLVASKRAGAGIAVLGAAAALGGWALLRIDVLREPVLPTDLPAGLDRAATISAIAVAVGSAVLAFRSGALTPAIVDEDDAGEAPE